MYLIEIQISVLKDGNDLMEEGYCVYIALRVELINIGKNQKMNSL